MNAGSLPTVAAFALTVLGNGLWQAALLAGAAWLVMRAARGANATTRHAVLVAALVGGLVLPVVTTTVAFTHPSTEVTPAVPVTSLHGKLPVHAAAPKIRHTEPVAVRPLGAQQQPAGPALRPQFTLPRIAILVLIGLWLVGALVLIGRLALSLLYLERLKHDALPLPIEYRVRLERWAAVGKGARDVRLCRSSEVAVPIAVGIFDAMILIPERLLEDLPAEDLDRILLHELAHLRRGDDWINALERIAEALLFFNPGIRWIVRQLNVEREVACDDWVLERRSEALPYAQCLVKLVEGVMWPYRPMTAPGVFVTRRSISIRIERLLAKQRDVRLRISPGPLAAVAGIAAAACLLGAYVSPSIAAGAATAATSSIASGTVAKWKAIVPPARRPSTRAPEIAGVMQPTTPPTSAESPAPTPVPSALTTAKRATAAAANASAPRTRTITALHAASTTRTSFAENSKTSTATATDVRSQVAALSNAESATPSPAMTGEDYIAEMAAAGYTNLSVDDLIKLKSLGVTGAYAREMQTAGFGHPAVHELAEMRAVGVTPQFAGDMRRMFPSVTAEDVISMRAVGVTSSYVSELRAAGVTHLSADAVRSMRAVGVDPAYVRQLGAAGYSNLSAQQLTQLRAVGVDGPFLKKVQEHGLHNLSLDELVRLKTSGVLFQ